MAGQLVKEYYGFIVVSAVVGLSILVGILTPQFFVSVPSLWLFSIIIGLALSFIIPFVASVRFHSPNIFDGDGNVWSFNEEQMAVAPMYGTHMAVITSGGFDNPKKLLAHENISSNRTTLLIAPARLVESVGNRRFVVIRAPLRRLGFWETKMFMSHHAVREIMARWDIHRAVAFIAMWTQPSLVPATFAKPRVDFERIAAYMSRLMTEVGVRRETVEESWRRALSDIERIKRSGPPPPPTTQPPEHREEQK